MIGLLQHDDFAPYVDKLFRFEGRHYALRLAAVDVSDRLNVPDGQRQPFILIFHGPRGDVMPEGLYAAEVEGGASFELYVIPIHTVAPDRQDYQAAFN